jgi:N-methylhydantoinase A
VNILLVGHGIADRPRGPGQVAAPVLETSQTATLRRAYFGPEAGWIDTPVLRRGDLATARSGPCIIEEYDATCLVPPGGAASLDRYANIVIDLD